MKKSFLLFVLIIAVLAVVFAGCGGGSPLVGKWYEETGYAGTMEFKDDGTCELEAMGFKFDGEYEFDAKTGEGEITIEFMGETESQDFEFKDGKLNIEGAMYTKTVVEQKSMEEVFEEIDLEGLELE